MELSIIIPVFNTESYIEECLNSIVNSSVFDISEVIVIDDGSTDKSADIIKKFCEKYENIKLYSYENAGLSEARNRGLKLAKGKYIAFADSDDILEKEYISRLYEKAKSENCDIVFAGFSRFTDDINNAEPYKRTALETQKVMSGCEYLERRMDTGDWEHEVWSAVYSSKFLKDNSLIFDKDIRVYEDILFTNEILLKAQKVYMMPEYGYFYRTREQSLTRGGAFTDFDLENLLAILKRYCAFYKNGNAQQKSAIGRASFELLSMLLFCIGDRENKDDYYKKLNELKLFPMLVKSSRSLKEKIKILVFKLDWHLFYKLTNR